MKRFIDKDALIERLDVSPLLSSIQPAWASKVGIIDIVDRFPTADAVEVVFCKDCKYCNRTSDQFGNLEYRCRKMNDYMSPIDYCSRGERKEKLK